MTTRFTPAAVRQAVELLGSRPLIRLVTEIDDNGAIPQRRLAATLPDLSSHQLRSTTDTARAHGLVRSAPGAGLSLTETGSDLADLYDATARWARRHAYPAPVCDFSSRVQHTLDLLTPSLVPEHTDGSSRRSIEDLTSPEVETDLARPRALLIQWLAGNPRIARLPEPGRVA
jgi:DNA-binding HxlR family transcriptional regulator